MPCQANKIMLFCFVFMIIAITQAICYLIVHIVYIVNGHENMENFLKTSEPLSFYLPNEICIMGQFMHILVDIKKC